VCYGSWSFLCEWKGQTLTYKECGMVCGLFYASEMKRPWHVKGVLWSVVSFKPVKGRDHDMWRVCYGLWSLLSQWKEETVTCKGCVMVRGLFYSSERKRPWHVSGVLWSPSLVEKCNEDTMTCKWMLWSMVSSECNEEIVTCKWYLRGMFILLC
jgi:hypothetical protein